MKDYLGDTVSDAGKRKFKAQVEQEQLANAWDMYQHDLKEGEEARKLLPEVLGRFDALEKAIARPLNVTAVTVAPAKPIGTIKRADPVDIVAAAVTAEFLRRSGQKSVATTLNQIFPGESGSFQRKMAKAAQVKSATHGATGQNAGWAAELVSSDTLGWQKALESVSVFGAVMGKGGHTLPFGNNGSLTVPRRDPSTVGSMASSFVAPGASIPVKSGTLASQTFTRCKAAVLSVVSTELVTVSVPLIFDVIKEMILMDTATMLDSVLLDPALAGVAGIRPASPWSGAATKASAGSTIADVLTDIAWLISSITEFKPRKPILIIDNMREQRLRMMRENGLWVFRDEIEKGTIFGIPLVVSANCPSDQVYIIDADDFMGWTPPPEIDISHHATIVMASDDGVAPTMALNNAVDDAGGSIHVSGAAATTPPAKVQNMLQSYAQALRLVQPVSWGLSRTGTAAYLTAVAW